MKFRIEVVGGVSFHPQINDGDGWLYILPFHEGFFLFDKRYKMLGWDIHSASLNTENAALDYIARYKEWKKQIEIVNKITYIEVD